jgi:DNA-binding IclR family transcriptional regulator
MIKNESNSSVPALQRGCEIISAISQNAGISCTELGELLGIPKASLNRMLKCLLENGFLEQDAKKGLRIGCALTYTVSKSHENSPLVMSSKKMLERLSSKWDATFVVYEYREPYQVIWQVKRESINGIKTQPPGLSTSKLNINAQGQLFLSQMSDEKIKKFYDEGHAKKATQFTIMTKDKMLERAEEIREKGYAIQERENHPSMKQVAVPLKFRNIPGVFALGCFLPLNYEKTEKLKDDMLLESGLLTNQE